VQQSRWSTLLGVPIALWGLLTYALLARMVWRLRTRPSSWRMALTVATVGAAVSWYLTAISVFVIEAVCIYCLVSFGIINALLVLLLVRRPAHMPEHEWAKSLPGPLGSAVVVVLALFLHFSGVFDPAAGPEKPYLRALAMHLSDSGARFYGAYWCPACQEQKALFEASVDRLPYVECTPDGRRGTRNFACVANDITDFPTWIVGGRRLTGVVSVSELAAVSGFAWSGGGAPTE
jgi:thiol-disulfide isomerase/thioredoxin